MHARTEELRQIMKDYDLKAEDVADMLEKEIITVRIWRCKNSRVIPVDTLFKLKVKVLAKAAA